MGANFSSEPVVEKHTERDQNETFTAAVSSCQGWRLSQEDEHSLILDLPGEHKASFFAVFDGHGSGRVSKHASVGLWRHLTENDKYIKGNFKEALEESFLSFDREVNESYNAQLAGTTAICILVVDNVIYCANVGDSRAVASINCECVPLSLDHKPENPLELKRILDAGGYVFSNRVNGNLALSRAFGDFHYKSNDQLPPDQQIVSPYPDIKRIELNDDVDFIVLACDGIWDVLSSKEVVKFVISRLEQNVEPGLICEQLTTRCIATDYELVIGCDNMTVLLVCYTRGRSWEDYCTDIFNKHSKLFGVQRQRILDDNLDTNLQQDDRFATDSSSAVNQDFLGRSMVDMVGQVVEREVTSSQNDTTTHVTEIPTDETPIPVEETKSEEPEVDDDKRVETDSFIQKPTATTESAQDDAARPNEEFKQDTPGATPGDGNDELISSGTTELHLSAPDETSVPSADQEEDSRATSNEENIVEDTNLPQVVQNIIELELSSPDDENPNDIQATSEAIADDTNTSTQDEFPEVVNDLEPDESPAHEAMASDSQANESDNQLTDN